MSYEDRRVSEHAVFLAPLTKVWVCERCERRLEIPELGLRGVSSILLAFEKAWGPCKGAPMVSVKTWFEYRRPTIRELLEKRP